MKNDENVVMGRGIGKDIRLSRIINPSDGKGLVVALDHGLPLGPMPGILNVRDTLGATLAGKPDGVILTPGQTRICRDCLLGRESPSLIMRLDWSNLLMDAIEPEGYLPICDVTSAVRFGALAVITYLFYGYENASARDMNVKNVAEVARQCEELGIPLIVEAMARGKRSKGLELDEQVMKIPVRMAAEMGADLIKTDFTGDIETFREIVRASPIPVMIAGGRKMDTVHDALQATSEALRAGAVGVFFGRNVFQAPNPAGMVEALKAVIHGNADVDTAERIVLKATA